MSDATLTLSIAVLVGVVLNITAHRLHVPSIVLLLIGGIVFGPEVLGVVQPEALHGGLETLIALGVAVILFEGGLTLDVNGYRRAPVTIKRLLTLGPLITWLGAAGTLWLLFDLQLGMALLGGSLVIVTGPTVISPLLRHLRIKERLHQVLYWEGVLIDPIGVFVAVLCYEWLIPGEENSVFAALGRFGVRLVIGVAIGALSGLSVAAVLKRRWVNESHVNIFVLACALGTFGVAHAALSESGILAVVVAGLVVGLRKPPMLNHVKRFKLQLTELGIGVLFVLLAAKLELNRFADPRLLFGVLVVMLVLRPTVVALATRGQGFHVRERLFMSWIGPRGIVAGAMASLFAIRLEEHANAHYLETFTYAVIAATVTIQGLSAPWVARRLGTLRSEARTWLITGGPVLAPAIARGLRQAGAQAVELVSDSHVLNEEELSEPRFADAGAVLCVHNTLLTNVWAVTQWAYRLPDDACFRWAPFETIPESELHFAAGTTGMPVWPRSPEPAEVAHGLETGRYRIDVLDLSQTEQLGRFGVNMQPLFWVQDGEAHLVSDPMAPRVPDRGFAVVLRRPIRGLADLLEHVEVVHERSSSFEDVLRSLIHSASRIHPELPKDEVFEGLVERRRTMPVAVGGGVAIPHAYWEGLDYSTCFLGVIPDGLDMTTPDGLPVRLVFLLISPLGQAAKHLESLAAISSLGQDPAFLELLSSQRVPDRIAAFILERA